MIDEYINTIINGNCVDVIRKFPDNAIDLVVTSPPYDNLRDYKGYTFPFDDIELSKNMVLLYGLCQMLLLKEARLVRVSNKPWHLSKWDSIFTTR